MAKTTKTPADRSFLNGVTYYASGSNHAGEIAALDSVGAAFGITAGKVNEASLQAVEATTDVPVFFDSGAFGEVEFPGGVPTVVKPISDATWRKRLALYLRLAKTIGSRLLAVAPDQVAFPAETLHRLAKYRDEMKAVADAGANIMVCLQGADKATFWQKAQWALGLFEADGIIPALPCAKNATSPAQATAFAAACKPRRIHLLGLGNTNRQVRKYIDGIRSVSPDTEISLDSCLITANVGKDNGRIRHTLEVKGGPRIMTLTNAWIAAAAKVIGETLTTTERKFRTLQICLLRGAV